MSLSGTDKAGGLFKWRSEAPNVVDRENLPGYQDCRLDELTRTVCKTRE
jgi:hypothetical protein